MQLVRVRVFRKLLGRCFDVVAAVRNVISNVADVGVAPEGGRVPVVFGLQMLKPLIRAGLGNMLMSGLGNTRNQTGIFTLSILLCPEQGPLQITRTLAKYPPPSKLLSPERHGIRLSVPPEATRVRK